MNQSSSFGGFVRQRRRELDLTQDELARRVGCAAITLRKIEADDLRASVQIAERLAMALAIPLEERAEFVRWARSVRPESSELPQVTPPPSIEEIGREDLTGRAIRGYALAERIGIGGMGSVYRAVQPNVEREVAVKIILPAFANHPDFIRRFEAEAQLVARLEHPHIVPLYDYWREPGVAYLVMRLLRGGNVQNILKQGPMPVDTTARMLEQICLALNAAHRIGVIHRDLKPANVLLDEDNNAYLADFGIAKNLGDPDFENQTQTDAMIGSPQYMSPEQIRSLSIRPQTDVYCLGVMMYEMLTGALPFTGPTPFDMIQQHINIPMPPLSAHKSGLPAALDAVIRRATAKEPEDRYADVVSLFNEFRQAIGNLVNTHTTAIRYEEEDTGIEITNPFKGLRAFSEADAENFFGRETLIQQLLARLGEGGDLSRFLAVIGPSGSGKSSVVRAGLIPALRRGGLPGSENWFIVDMLPGKHPFEELEASLLRVAVNPPQSLLSQLKDGSRGLFRAVHRILPADESVELVLVIDQFEEVFTLVEDEAERALLLESLATAVLDERSRLRVIITLRADFTDKPLRYVDFGEMMNRRFEFILPLTADEVERAIAGPAQRAGLRLEKGLVSTIIREAGNQPGTLPLLQHALSELFDRREGRLLTNKAYREIDGVLGALGRSAEKVYAGLDKAGQAGARQLFLRLVTLGEGTEDTRRRVLRDELENLTDSIPLPRVIEAFGRARLLSFDRDPITRGPTVEVAHEALLREWSRLREWLSESRADVRLQRQLANAASEWKHAGQEPSFLLAGARLEQIEGWAENTTVALTQEEQAYLHASIRERDRRELEERTRQERELENLQKLAEAEKQRAEEQTLSAGKLRKRAIYLTGAFAVALILAVAALFFARQAQITARLATSRELATASISNLEEDPERSLLLALQAASSAHTLEAENALHLSILASRTRLILNHDDRIWSVIFSPDGKRVATASQDTTAKIWDSATGKLLLTLRGHTASVNGIVYSPDGRRVATTSDDGTAKVWDASTGEELLTFSGHTDWVARIAFSPDGARLVTTSADLTAKMWDSETGEELLSFSTQEYFMFDVAFHPDGTRIATCSDDGFVRIWDASSGKELLALPVEGGVDIRGVTFSPDGTRVAVASDGFFLVKVWDANSGEELLSSNLDHTAFPVDIAFSPDGNLAATGGGDEPNAKVWDPLTGEVLYTLTGHTSGIGGVAFSPDGTRLATASWDHTARVWDIRPAQELLFIPRNLQVEEQDILRTFDVRYSSDGTKILTDDPEENSVKLWDTTSGKQLLTFEGHADFLDYSEDEKMVAASRGVRITIWDATEGKQQVTLLGHENYISGIEFSPDGKYLASIDIEGTAIIWDLASSEVLFKFEEPDLYFSALSYSPDGNRLAVGDAHGVGVIWNTVTGEKLSTLSFTTGEFGESIFSSAFSPDGKRLAFGNKFGLIRIYDAVSGTELLTWRGHPGRVESLAFSPDGNRLATAGDDGIASLWDAGTGMNLLALPVDDGGTGDVAFSPDGTRLAVGGMSGVYVFVLPVEELVALAKSRVTRQLTNEECRQYLHVEHCPAAP